MSELLDNTCSTFPRSGGFQSSASAVGQHFLSEATDDLGFALLEHVLELNDVGNLSPAWWSLIWYRWVR